jgi:tetratricopeptide (TPR) repeat protein
MLFQHLKSEQIDILELGLARTTEDFRGRSDRRSGVTSPSVSVWLDYFPNARVTGFDLSDFSDQRCDRFDFVRGDLGDRDDLRKIAELGRQFDIVVDDGSHATFHQMLAFAELFSLVKEGGFFVIEDLILQPEDIEAAHPPSHKMAELIREFLRLGCFPETAPVPSDELNRHIATIGNVLMVPYHNEVGSEDQLVVIHKRSGSRYHHYRAKIRFYKRDVIREDIPSLERHLEVDPDCPYPHAHLCSLALAEGRYEQALAHAESALALAREDIDLSVLYCRALAGLSRGEEAAEAAVRVMTNAPKAERVARELTLVLVNSGVIEPARTVARRLLDLDANSSRACYLLGRCLEAEKSWAEATRHFLAAFERLPGNLMYLKCYARNAMRAEKDRAGKENVINYLLAQETQFRGHSGFQLMLARNYQRLGRLDKAREHAWEAAKDPQQAPGAEKFLGELPKLEG